MGALHLSRAVWVPGRVVRVRRGNVHVALWGFEKPVRFGDGLGLRLRGVEPADAELSVGRMREELRLPLTVVIQAPAYRAWVADRLDVLGVLR